LLSRGRLGVLVPERNKTLMANDALRKSFLILMAAAPMRDYSLDPIVQLRVGKLFADQADERARVQMTMLPTLAPPQT
jgi:hypothetical protein